MGDDGHYLTFFSSINDLAKSMADDIGRDVGAWLRISLLKQGWKMGSIQLLIKKSFTPEAAEMASRARLDKKSGHILSGYGVTQMEVDRAMDELGIINRMLGYTDSELAAMKAEEDRLSGGEAMQMPVLTASSFNQFQFGEEMSLQTLTPGRKHSGLKSVRGDDTYKLGPDSQFSIRTDESTGFEDFHNDDHMEEKEQEVHIELPKGGLAGMDVDGKKPEGDGAGMEVDESVGSQLTPIDMFSSGRFHTFTELSKCMGSIKQMKSSIYGSNRLRSTSLLAR